MIRRIVPVIAALAAIVPAARLDADVVYFVSKTDGGLYSLNTSGGAITTISGTGTFTSPSALALGPDGNLYVGDATDGGSIKRYVTSSGSISMVAPLNGTGPAFSGAPVNPAAIAFTPGGAMLVGRNPEVAFFPGGVAAWPGGSVLSITGWQAGESPAIASYTSGTTQNYSPGLAVAADGTLYTSNSFYDAGTLQMTGNVISFNSSGADPTEVAADQTGSGLSGPAGLALSGNSLFIASTMNGNVYRTDLANPNPLSNTVLFGSTGGDYLGPLVLLSDGGLLAASVLPNSGTIYRFNASGNLIGTFGGPSYGQIGGIAAVPEPGAMLLAATAGVVLSLRHSLGRRRKA
jgi:sugar lactone lactonase YvrE